MVGSLRSIGTRTNTVIPVGIAAALVALLVSIGGSFDQNAYAATVIWDGGGDGTNWSDELNWDTNAVPTGADSITIPDGYLVFLDNGFELTSGSITIESGGTVVLVSELAILEGGTLHNNGGLGVNNGAFLDNKGVIYNGGSIDQAGILENGGTIINDGEIPSNGIIDNYGKIENSASGIVWFEGIGTLVNSGSIQSSGTIEVLNDNDFDPVIHNVGSIENSGSINVLNGGLGDGVANYGTIVNGGTLRVANTEGVGVYNVGMLTNSGILLVKNSEDGSIGIENDGGTIINTDMMSIENTIDLSYGILNLGGGTIENTKSGSFDVTNIGGRGVYNYDFLTNLGALTVGTDSSIINEGTFTSCGTVLDLGDVLGPISFICPSAATADLIENIEGQVIENKVEKSLLAPLKQVQRILDDGNPDNDISACGKLDEFIANVDSKEASGKLDSALADEYKAAAIAIKTEIGC